MTALVRLLKEYLDYLEIEKNRSPKTRENYERYLKEFLASSRAASPSHITEPVIRDFRLALARKNLKKITQSYYVIALRNFLKYLRKRDIAAVSPEKIELPKIPDRQIEILDYRDLERLLTPPARTDLRALRDQAVVETFFSTGMRLQELCMLPRAVDLARGEISVRGKGDKLRVVFLSDRARAALKTYLAKREDTDPALFVSVSKGGAAMGRITPRAVERLIEARAKRAGIPRRVHPHQFRHAFATDLLINGADLRSVQELLGHANIATTQVYTHLTNKALREVHEAFHGRRRKEA